MREHRKTASNKLTKHYGVTKGIYLNFNNIFNYELEMPHKKLNPI